MIEKNRIKRLAVAISAFALVGLCSRASAAVISVNFIQDVGNANQQIDANEVFGIPNLETVVGGWINLNGPANNLPDSMGNVTPVRLLSVSQPNSQATFNSAYTNTPLFAGFDDYTGTINPTSVTLTNLASHFPFGYKIIVFLGGFASGANTNLGASISDGSTTYYYRDLSCS